MILLDTDVLSTLMGDRPDPLVFAWMDRQAGNRLYMYAITIQEILFGIRLMPPGKKREELSRSFSAIQDEFRARILDLDRFAADEAATFRAQRRKAGRPMGLADAQIAGIAKSNGLSLATFNTKDFLDIDLRVIKPR